MIYCARAGNIVLEYILNIYRNCRRIHQSNTIDEIILEPETAGIQRTGLLIQQLKTCTNTNKEDETETPTCKEGIFCEACDSNKRLFFQACLDGNILGITVLLRAIGYNKVKNFKDRGGATPFFYAICGNNVEAVSTLLPLFDINSEDYLGFTPLMEAILVGGRGIMMVDFLLGEGANPYHLSRIGLNPLLAACLQDNEVLISSLIRYMDLHLNPPSDQVWNILDLSSNIRLFKLVAEKKTR